MHAGNMCASSEFVYYRGRVGLYAVLNALGVSKGSEVATQAFTCVAVPEAIMACGAAPRFIDIEPEGFNMCPVSLRRGLTKQVRAIVIQHTFGIPAEVDGLLKVANEYGVPVIEDCCHTINSAYAGRRVGTFGAGAFYSYEWGKPLVAGIGGSLVVNDQRVAKEVEATYKTFIVPPKWLDVRLGVQYMLHAILYRPRFYWSLRRTYKALSALRMVQSNYNVIDLDRPCEEFKWRMSPRVERRMRRKLRCIECIDAHAVDVASHYCSEIPNRDVQHPVSLKQSRTVYCRYPLRSASKKELLQEALRCNVELADWYRTPVHPLSGDQLAGVNYSPGSCPNAELRCTEVVTLPVNRLMKPGEVDRVIRFFKEL